MHSLKFQARSLFPCCGVISACMLDLQLPGREVKTSVTAAGPSHTSHAACACLYDSIDISNYTI